MKTCENCGQSFSPRADDNQRVCSECFKKSGSPIAPENLRENEDYYFENGMMVFTEKYHLKRGHCCQSGCRHCPYGFKK